MTEEAEKQGGSVLDKDIQVREVTASALISEVPCRLYSVVLTTLAAGANNVTLHDGHSTAGETKFYMSGTQYTTTPMVFKHPVRFNRGLYYNVVTGTVYATFQYKTDY